MVISNLLNFYFFVKVAQGRTRSHKIAMKSHKSRTKLFYATLILYLCCAIKCYKLWQELMM